MNTGTTFIIIDEDTVQKAAEYCQDDEMNSFRRIWKVGQEYKEAGMTPVYLLDQSEMQLTVVAGETFGKKLN
jgi:hypothetical protein